MHTLTMLSWKNIPSFGSYFGAYSEKAYTQGRWRAQNNESAIEAGPSVGAVTCERNSSLVSTESAGSARVDRTLIMRKLVPKPTAAMAHPIHPTTGSILWTSTW